MTTVAENIALTDKGRGLAGSGLVVIWNGIRDDMREDFMEWHPRQHMVERLSIPGFVRGRRCIAVDGGTEFLTIYELTNPEVLVTDVYKQRLANPTEWSTSTLPAFTDNTRGACRLLFTEGVAMGGFITTLRLAAQPGRDVELVDEVNGRMARFMHLPRITGAHFARNDLSLTGGNAGNQRGRVIMLPELILMIEGSDPGAVVAACDSLLPDEWLQQAGATTASVRGLYRLEYSVAKLW